MQSAFKYFAFASLVAALVANTPQVVAQTAHENELWTSIGSAGVVDEADVSKVFFDHSIVQRGRQIGNSQPVGGAPTNSPAPSAATQATAPILQTESATIRYNVTAAEGFFAPRPAAPSTRGSQLVVRYLASGAGARVVAKLIEVDTATGVETTLLTFDSKAFPPSNAYQEQQTGNCQPPPFDFKRKAYYVEATLTGSALVAVSAAGIQTLRLDNAICRG
jgi:hypothetical protein